MIDVAINHNDLGARKQSFSMFTPALRNSPSFLPSRDLYSSLSDLINSQKDASRTKAIEIFPKKSSILSKKKDSNKADAILISSFYYETYKKDD